MIKILLLTSMFLFAAPTVNADILEIGPGEPYSTIQDAIDAASPGDTIIVDARIYNEYLHITTDNLTIDGAGIDQSIIDLDELTSYWHYSGCSSSYASRADVLISGYGSPDEGARGTITVTILRDVNGDFIVDIFDLVMVANHYGKTTP